MTSDIPGYTAGAQTLARSPISLEAFATMQKSVLFDDQDVRALRQSYDVVKDQVEAILDVWYGFVGSQPHLLASFTHRDSGAPLGDYLGAVRRRFEARQITLGRHVETEAGRHVGRLQVAVRIVGIGLTEDSTDDVRKNPQAKP